MRLRWSFEATWSFRYWDELRRGDATLKAIRGVGQIELVTDVLLRTGSGYEARGIEPRSIDERKGGGTVLDVEALGWLHNHARKVFDTRTDIAMVFSGRPATLPSTGGAPLEQVKLSIQQPRASHAP